MTITASDYKDLYNPVRPYSTNVLREGLYRHNKTEALTHLFTQTTSKKAPNLLVLDFDIPDAEWATHSLIYDDGTLPPYNYLTINPATTHAQAGWFIEGTAGTVKAKQFYDDIHAGLTAISGGDRNYTGFIGRNPTHPHQRTLWGTDTIYSLKDLKAFIPNTVSRGLQRTPNTADGRNVGLFEALRHTAYRLRYENAYNTPTAFNEVLTDIGRTLNNQTPNPLTDAEVKTITRSITKFVFNQLRPSHAHDSETQKRRAAAASKKRTQQAQQRHAEVLELRNKGYTTRNIAEHYNLTIGGAKALIHRARNN